MGLKARRRAWWLVAAALVLAAAALFAWGVASGGAGPGGSVTIPPTTGLSVAQATDALTRAGLVVGEPKAQASTDISRGDVIDTEPGEGETVDRDSPVVLVISSGPAAVTVPELGGMSLSDARDTLEAIGLNVDQLDEVDSPRPRDEVLTSRPPFGEVLDQGDVVALTIASGSNVVPDIEGLPRSEANSRLVDDGFQVSVETIPAAGTPGTVLEVRPAPGVRQPVGTSITILVSQATDTSTAPGSG